VLITKLYAIIFLLATLWPTWLIATTVVVAVSKDGIVISTDSKTTFRAADFSETGEREQSKFVIVKQRLVVIAIGVSDYRDTARHYNFLAWMQGVQLKLPDNITPDQLAGIIGKESESTFAALGVNKSLADGTLKNKTPAEPCEIFAQFVIVGYQDAVARIQKVQFDIDWNHHTLVGPTRIVLYPDGAESNYRVIRFGTQQAITDFLNRKSYAHQQAMALCPKAMADIDSSRYPSFDETVALTRALVQVEENTNPDEVGGPIRTVRVLPTGRAEENGTNTLPKAGTCKKKKANKNP